MTRPTPEAAHAHAWVFDTENPPGYVCNVVGCDAATGACCNCEAPTHMLYCSGICEAEYAELGDEVTDV